MAIVPTVSVAHEGGYKIINQSDYDPDIHELVEIEEDTDDLDTGFGEYDIEVKGNGSWTISLDGEVIKKGRGKKALEEFKESLEAADED